MKDSKLIENTASKLKSDKMKGSKQQVDDQVAEQKNANPTILLDVPS